MPLLASSFFYKETGIYIIAVCFIQSTEDLNWVMNFHFHDTCFRLLLFILPAILTKLS